MWTDSHCHLPPGEDGHAHVRRAREAGVTRLVSVGTDAASSADAVALARECEGVWATAGLHPHAAVGGLDGVVPLLHDPEVVAVGECGLDYHYDYSPRDVQRRAFAAQVALAGEQRMALVVHCREAWDDAFAVLTSEGVPERTVFHCFTGGPAEARRALDLGAWLSFSGIVTFKGADDVRAAAALCPADRLLVETDSPYLAPVPHRGRPNRPDLLPAVGAGVAAARGTTSEEVAAATWSAAEDVFDLVES
jgi:TatD DNase family protein